MSLVEVDDSGRGGEVVVACTYDLDEIPRWTAASSSAQNHERRRVMFSNSTRRSAISFAFATSHRQRAPPQTIRYLFYSQGRDDSPSYTHRDARRPPVPVCIVRCAAQLVPSRRPSSTRRHASKTARPGSVKRHVSAVRHDRSTLRRNHRAVLQAVTAPSPLPLLVRTLIKTANPCGSSSINSIALPRENRSNTNTAVGAPGHHQHDPMPRWQTSYSATSPSSLFIAAPSAPLFSGL